ncbi:hypothetical protein DSM112329_04501 [Paraconexibacter sp. AEG42_29]|uniref:DUF4328 domain-containing protein n=1 Tax=Paraconexibacter sp. AEG42_29 TaxID=2997339 RepID=A0AAU7B0Z7_9ACTN
MIGSVHGHRSAAARARRVESALQAVVVAALLALLAAVNDLLAIDAFLDGSRSVSVLDHSETLRLVTLWTQFAVLAIAAGCYLHWQAQATANLGALGLPSGRWTARSAAASWVTPGVNLVQPKRVTDDLWRSGDPAAPTRTAAVDVTGLPVAMRVHLWWALWIGAWIVGLAGGLATDRESLDSSRAGDILDGAADVLIIAGAVMTSALVHRITERQDARAAALAQRMAVGLASGLGTPGNLPRASPQSQFVLVQ